MKLNPLKELEALGQSIWLDYIKNDLIHGGGLLKLIKEDGLRGITSNPSIFEKGIAETQAYDKDIQTFQKNFSTTDVNSLYEHLTQQDVREAADVFRPLFDATQGKDGYVSLEVNPHLARDTQGTIEEARRLWKSLDRPNVMIKVPATEQGILAIKQLISEGINVNITLLFGLPRYRKVAYAYLEGLEERIKQGKPIQSIASVASFFLSRIDVLLDPVFEQMMAENKDNKEIIQWANQCHGEIAIASAKMAYQIYQEIFGSERFKNIIAKGGNVQRLLWASTSTKNPSYSPVKYVEALIGPATVNTLPMETLEDYRKQGKPELRLEQDIKEAQIALENLPKLGINIDATTQQLEQEGVNKFIKSFDHLLLVLEKNPL